MNHFFNNSCQETPHQLLPNNKMGLCDVGNQTRAYSSLENPDSWIATIHNNSNQAISVQVTALDNCDCLKFYENKEKTKLADLLICFDNILCVIELKDRTNRHWFSGSIKQLIKTIQLLQQYNPNELKRFQDCRAYAANKQKPFYQPSQRESIHKFYTEIPRTVNFKLHTKATINIHETD